MFVRGAVDLTHRACERGQLSMVVLIPKMGLYNQSCVRDNNSTRNPSINPLYRALKHVRGEVDLINRAFERGQLSMVVLIPKMGLYNQSCVRDNNSTRGVRL